MIKTSAALNRSKIMHDMQGEREKKKRGGGKKRRRETKRKTFK